MRRVLAALPPGYVFLAVMSLRAMAGPIVNWENPPVYPLERTPDGTKLLAVNTPDARLEVFDITGQGLAHIGSIPVGLDPVTVRARTNAEVWVVNHISDSISIVSLSTMNVLATIETLDEPADVVFAGMPERAFVSCSQANTVQVFDPADLTVPPIDIPIDAEDPRAMAVSPSGDAVYVAIFESGNGSTILGGGREFPDSVGDAFPPNVVSDPLGPYGGQNPPPNDGNGFNPPMNPDNPAPPEVGQIVKKDEQGNWIDDNNGDWTDFVSGSQAAQSGRPIGWDLPDRDVAMIDTSSLQVSYANRLMNIVMAIAVNPASGQVTIVGTDATNQIRFEPNLSGRFLRVNFASFAPSAPNPPTIVDLNPHLTYNASTISQSERNRSVGDPRGIVWNAAGSRGYVAGMGSNNVVVIDQDGAPAGVSPTIEVGEGPVGLVLDEFDSRLYVFNRFSATISIVDTMTETELTQFALFDPTPMAIKVGRRHFYDTHKNSGLGHIACASCHVDARMDRLAWDLGDPAGVVKPFNQNCNSGGAFGPDPCPDWHPMKGPILTQTFQDVIGKEPLHWRGDRDGLEEFNGAFMSLLGDDQMLTAKEMQEFEDFLATITFPPNPFRNFDNSLPSDLPLPDHYTTGRFGPAGQPLPNGDADFGRQLFQAGKLGGGILFGHTQCVTCHTLPTGTGSNLVRVGNNEFEPLPPGPNGEEHHTVVSLDDATMVSLDVPQLRNLYERVGFETTQISNRAGFGFTHNGAVDSLARFISEPAFFGLTSDQEVADLVAFMLAFSGSDLPLGSTVDAFIPGLLGPLSQDTHAAVGTQVTLDGTNNTDPGLVNLIDAMVSEADSQPDEKPGPMVGVVAKGRQNGLQRGYAYVGDGMFQSDRAVETITVDGLRLSADVGEELTFTVVPAGTEIRIGVDRDGDGFLDSDELDACSHPANSASIPGTPITPGDYDRDGNVDLTDFFQFEVCYTGLDIIADAFCACSLDFDSDGDIDCDDWDQFRVAWTEPTGPPTLTQCAGGTMGACCFGNGFCTPQTQVDCEAVEGQVYLGDGTECVGDFTCPAVCWSCQCTDGFSDSDQSAIGCVAEESGCSDLCQAHGGLQSFQCDLGPCASIPTVSEWGLVVMTLLMLTAGTLVLARARAQWEISAQVVDGGADVHPRVYDAIADPHKKEARR